MKKSLKMKSFLTLAAGACFLAQLATSANAATCFAVVTGSWSSPSTWASTAVAAGGTCTAAAGGVPGAGDTANIIAPSLPVTVTVPGTPVFSVAHLNMDDNTTLTGVAGSKIQVSPSAGYGFNASSFGINLNSVEIELMNGPNLTIGGGTLFMNNNSKILARSGAVIDANSNIEMTPAAEIELRAGATLNVGASATILGALGGGSKITNAGTVNISNNVTQVSLHNNKDVDCNATCVISLGSNSNLNMLATAAKLSGAGTISKTGTLTLADGEVSIEDIIATLVDNTGATLKPGAGSITIPRSMTITGDYTQGIGGLFWVNRYATTNDLITVTGNAVLNSSFVKFLFEPQLGTGTMFDVFQTGGSLTGASGFPNIVGYGFGGDQALYRTTSDTIVGGNSLRISYVGSKYQVQNTSDSGVNSLREAITSIDADLTGSCGGAPYQINMELLSGTISPATALPALGKCRTTVDGTNDGQIGYSTVNNNAARFGGSNATFLSSIGGGACSSCDGLTVVGPNPVTIKGVHIDGFSGSGISLQSTAVSPEIYGVRLSNNNIGIYHAGSVNTKIGSPAPADRNVIYGGGNYAIESQGQTGTPATVIENNVIGPTELLGASLPPPVKGIFANSTNNLNIFSNVIGEVDYGIFNDGSSHNIQLGTAFASTANKFDNTYTQAILNSGGNGAIATPTIVTAVASMGNAQIDFTHVGIIGNSYEFLVCDNATPASECQLPVASQSINNGTGTVTGTITIPSVTPPKNYTIMVRDTTAVASFGNTSELSASATMGAFTYSPDPGTFPPMVVGATSAPITVTVTNVGASDTLLNVTNGGPFNPFNVVAGPGTTCIPTLTLAPNGTCTIEITFSPVMPAASTGGYVYVTTVNDNNFQIALSSGLIAPTLSITPPTATFTAPNGVTTPFQTFMITNNSAVSRNITSFSLPAGFNIVAGGTCLTPPTLIAASPSACTVRVTYTASATNTGGNFSVNHDGVDMATSVTLTGAVGGAGGATFSFSNPVPQTTSLNVGVSQTISIFNSMLSPTALSASAFAITAPFSITGNTCLTPVAIAGSCTVTVTFTPTSTGSFSQNLTFNHDGTNANPFSIPFNGTGTAALPATFTVTNPAPQSTPINTSVSQNITINNTSTSSTLTVGTFAVAAPFSVPANPCPMPIAISSFCTFTVTFSPLTVASFTPNLTFTHNGAGASPYSFALNGTGTAAPPPTSAAYPCRLVHSTRCWYQHPIGV